MYELVLPDIGEGVVEAEIQKWFVAVGDEVHEDQPLVEVMTDKATVTIPSPRRGRVAKLLWAEGQVAKVHDVLLVLELHPEARAAQAEQRAAQSFPSAATAPLPGPGVSAPALGAPEPRPPPPPARVA